MMMAKNLVALCLLLKCASVLGNGWGNTHRVQMNPAARTSQHQGAAYDTTVTTEMSYYESDSEDSKSEKERNYHAEYEYISAGGHARDAAKSSKSGKKSGGYHTHAPTHRGSYHPNGKGSKTGGYRTHAPTQMDTYYSTEYGTESGKGKGGSSSSSSSSSKSSKSSKQGKGASRKGSKKGGDYPIHTPYPSSAPHAPSGDYGTTRPPTPITQPTPGVRPTLAPVSSPSITASPTDEGSVAFDLDPFGLQYETETKRQASRAELAELTDVTRQYLEEFMFDEFSGSSFTFLDDFITRMITSTFLMGNEPYIVDYSATARFNPFSTVFPSTEQLNEALVIAFSGSNMVEYESRLAGLPDNNVFHGASCSFGEPVVRVSKKSSNNAATIAAAAVAATLLAAGAVLYKRRRENEPYDGKDLNKHRGDATIAGDTFTGETYDGSASVSVASLDHLSRYRDEDEEEERTKAHSLLGTIQEDEDGDSVRPSWNANPSYDDEEVALESLQNTMDDRSMVSQDTDNRVLRRAATEGSSVAASTPDSGLSATQSFDEMALQGLSHKAERKEAQDEEDHSSHSSEGENDHFDGQDEIERVSKPEIASLLSHDSMDGPSIARTTSSSSSSRNSRRPKTVEEIEAMLSADNDENDEESQGLGSTSRSFGNDNSTAVSSQRPRTVEEIESLLSAGLGDDYSEGTELD